MDLFSVIHAHTTHTIFHEKVHVDGVIDGETKRHYVNDL